MRVPCLFAVVLALAAPGAALAMAQELPGIEQPQGRLPGDAAERAAREAQNSELRGLCAADDLRGFVNLLAQSPVLRSQRTASDVRRVDDASDTSVPSEEYVDFPLEALDWNLIRRGSERARKGPQHLLIKTGRPAGGVGQVFWFEAVYDDEPLGDAPGTLLATSGPLGLLTFKMGADGCWMLTEDVRGRRAVSAFFDGA